MDLGTFAPTHGASDYVNDQDLVDNMDLYPTSFGFVTPPTIESGSGSSTSDVPGTLSASKALHPPRLDVSRLLHPHAVK